MLKTLPASPAKYDGFSTYKVGGGRRKFYISKLRKFLRLP